MEAKEILETAAVGFTTLIVIAIVWNVINMMYLAGKKIGRIKHNKKIREELKNKLEM